MPQESLAIWCQSIRLPSISSHTVVLFAACTAFLCGAAGYSFFQSTLTDSLVADLHTSRSTIAALWTGALLVSASLQPFIGRAIDHFGGRTALCATVPCFVVGLACLAFGNHIAWIGAGYSLLRISGPEGMEVIGRVTVNKWYVRQRGFANAVLSVVEVSTPCTVPSPHPPTITLRS